MADLVLIVDDDEAVRTTLYKVIRSNGLDAEMASGGEQALERIGSKHYDLILLDVNMQGRSSAAGASRHLSSLSAAEKRITTHCTDWTSAPMTM